MTSDLDRIREALTVGADCLHAEGYTGLETLAEEALALLDGAVGLTRAGDVVLSAEQALRGLETLRQVGDGWGIVGASFPARDLLALIALLASGRPGEEQA